LDLKRFFHLMLCPLFFQKKMQFLVFPIPYSIT
jgi:hypothetical protein